jgi:hypothetical protein
MNLSLYASGLMALMSFSLLKINFIYLNSRSVFLEALYS